MKKFNKQISLGDADVRKIANKPSGVISLADLRGKTGYKLPTNIHIEFKVTMDDYDYKIECNEYYCKKYVIFRNVVSSNPIIYDDGILRIKQAEQTPMLKLDWEQIRDNSIEGSVDGAHWQVNLPLEVYYNQRLINVISCDVYNGEYKGDNNWQTTRVYSEVSNGKINLSINTIYARSLGEYADMLQYPIILDLKNIQLDI